jgi:hypothetical protein
MNEHDLPQHVQEILARHDEGRQLRAHELLTVQMVRNGYGCASCAHPSRPPRNSGCAN